MSPGFLSIQSMNRTVQLEDVGSGIIFRWLLGSKLIAGSQGPHAPYSSLSYACAPFTESESFSWRASPLTGDNRGTSQRVAVPAKRAACLHLNGDSTQP